MNENRTTASLFPSFIPSLFHFFILSFFHSFTLSFSQTTTITTFRESGLDCSWDQSGSDRIAYSCKGDDKYYDIHLALPDGSHDTCITCNHPFLPNRHICCPAWHPSGKWLLFLAEKKVHPRGSIDALPGFGAFSDIWVMTVDGKKCFKILDIVNDYDHGVIAARFSPDGKHIVWTDRVKRPNIFYPTRNFGYWNIKMADFYFGEDSVPYISNIHAVIKDDKSFYEEYGFSPDGKQIIFCSSFNQKSAWNQQIFVVDTSGNNVKQLTSGTDYNEHGAFTPDGKKILWMSNKDNKNKGTDWWMMNTESTNKKRITFLNDQENKQYAGKAVWTGLGSFSPKGNKFAGGVQKSLITQEGKIVIVEIVW